MGFGADTADLSAILADTAELLVDALASAAALTTVDTIVDAIKAITDNLPDSGALSDLAAIKAITDNLPDSGALSDLATILASNAVILADTGELQTEWVDGGRLDALLDAIKAKTDTLPIAPAGSDTSTLTQETAAATDVNGTTWKDLLDKSTITVPTRIVGFKVTKGGTWTGNPKIRITKGDGTTKIWPYQDELVMDTDFSDGALTLLTLPVEVTVADGYKMQFRSSAAGDGAGESLQLDQLDIIGVG